MQKTLQSAGFLLAIAGVAGLVHHFVHGFRLFAFVARIPFLARYDLYVSAARAARSAHRRPPADGRSCQPGAPKG